MEVDGREVQFGDDTSGYQPDYDYLKSFDEGYVFSFIKCSEGNDWKSPTFHKQMARARAAKKLVAAYHYMNGNNAEAQVYNVASMIGKETPVILDVEWISANQEVISVDTVWGMVRGLQREGYKVAFVYIPEWYWRDWMGKPNLTGLPLNWRSWYPDNNVRTGIQTLKLIPERIFTDMIGGLATAIVQITSSGRVGNYPNGRIDLNVFRGSIELLRNLLEGIKFMSGVWDEMITREPTASDPRTEVPAGEMAKWTNVAAWGAFDTLKDVVVPTLNIIVSKLEASLSNESAILSQLSVIRSNMSTLKENDESADTKLDSITTTVQEIKEALDNPPSATSASENVSTSPTKPGPKPKVK